MTFTPEQFNKIVTKDDLEKSLANKADKQDIAKILSTLDAMNKTLTDRETEDTAHTSSHRRLQTTLDDHEIRITKIEKVKVLA